jgi:hypothetical protein
MAEGVVGARGDDGQLWVHRLQEGYREGGIGAAVHGDLCSVRALDGDGVGLAQVEEVDVELAVGRLEGGDPGRRRSSPQSGQGSGCQEVGHAPPLSVETLLEVSRLLMGADQRRATETI